LICACPAYLSLQCNAVINRWQQQLHVSDRDPKVVKSVTMEDVTQEETWVVPKFTPRKSGESYMTALCRLGLQQ